MKARADKTRFRLDKARQAATNCVIDKQAGNRQTLSAFVWEGSRSMPISRRSSQTALLSDHHW